MSELATLLDDVQAYVRRYVVLTEEQGIAVALWTVHTHAVDALGITPYLNISSAVKSSGKTQLLEVLQYVVARPWLTGSVSPAVLARKIHAQSPTLLLDESDTAFKGDQEYAEALRGVLNSGFKRSGTYSRCIGNGAALEVQDFNTFSAKAIAGLGANVPDTVRDRSIPIRLKKRMPGETISRKRDRKLPGETAALKEQIEMWAEANLDHLSGLDLSPLDGLPDRAADIWEPLLGIARLAGDSWLGRAQKAALALSGLEKVDDESTGVQLLTDVRAIFDATEADHISSASMVASLLEFEESPWADWHGGRGFGTHALAKRLKPFEIRPKKIRDGDTTANGYRRGDFEDSWSRYLPGTPPAPPDPPYLTGTTGTLAQPSQKQPVSNWNTEDSVPVRKQAANPHGYADVPLVPIRKGGKQTFPDCIVCESPFDPDQRPAELVRCGACVALGNGIVTESEADEMRFLSRLKAVAA